LFIGFAYSPRQAIWPNNVPFWDFIIMATRAGVIAKNPQFLGGTGASNLNVFPLAYITATERIINYIASYKLRGSNRMRGQITNDNLEGRKPV
jgi:hypothetical protein